MKNIINKIILENNLMNENDLIKRKELQDKLSSIDKEDILEDINELPYFTADRFFHTTYRESRKENLTEDISYQDWYGNYKLLCMGIISENNTRIMKAWCTKVSKLCEDLKICTKEEKEYVNQDLLDLGWNPIVDFNNYDHRYSVCKETKELIKSNLKNNTYDISDITVNETTITESTNNQDKYPLYVVLVYTGSGFSKVIKKYTKGIYTHAGISLDANMNKIYSYSVQDNGFTIDNVDQYNKGNDDRQMVVYTIYVSKNDIETIKRKLDYFILNKNKTKYSILNIFGLIFNKPIEVNNNMICSQFVDSILKTININITNKNSAIVTPNDLYLSLNPKTYKLFEGDPKDYTSSLATNIHNLFTKISPMSEQTIVSNELVNIKEDVSLNTIFEYGCTNLELKKYIDLDYMNEAKEFPVQFDNDGNLLISKIEKIDYNSEYAKSHKLLMAYHEANNIEGMKYELAKLWFLNTLLEKKIYDVRISREDTSEYHKSRARILNDFKKYIKDVNKADPVFNFDNYYNTTPFSDATIKINKSTLKYGGELIKNLSKLMI